VPAQLHSYVVAQDYGFAPNPFHCVCSLATCKPIIRQHAKIGDFIVGTGSADHKRTGFLVYYMCVAKILTFNEYWEHPDYQIKKPDMRGSKMRWFGDNIYHRDSDKAAWQQAPSYHSLRDGNANPLNVDTDTKSQKVMIGTDYAYWGGEGPKIPERFRNWNGVDVCRRRGHRRDFPELMVIDFVAWLRSLKSWGYAGRPFDWRHIK
jgi:hypothetical protein